MTSEASQPPPMAWRYCGNQIKLWRTRAGVTREELGKAANYEYETIRSMEQGRRRPTLRLLEIADELCGAHGLLVAATDYLRPEKFPSFSLDFMRYEAEATVLNSYQNQLIPGLLQTEATARALLNAHWPPFDDETVEERVAARLARQSLLKTQTKSFNFVIDEAALLRPIGNAETHIQQLRHLRTAGEPRHVTVQVVPATGAHPGVNGSFVLLETPEHDRLAYEEGQAMGALYADPEKVSMLTQRHTMILRQALSPEESAQFISKLAEEL
ncbi:helix-turn-helix transcriptional regulator [Kitasatospora sp. GP82]|uniref:helix-turn-helix domain-containing protein n=1 Tax=Kitasatospora sp. GP82 TaxID=3035089 RepID=UPI00247612AC|nr:helix-turn-helix transcriptional regulator [Kitasatospora sp. GP82]MDH6126027.1 transcriptional regulator with XRE-family HTH domain [Kitasatospora sp. GP82]